MMRVRDNDPRPPYVQIADDLRDQIAGGAMKPGDRLRPVRLLAEDYGVAQMTVWQAIRVLKEENLLVSWQGRGTFVTDRTRQVGVVEAEGESEIIERLDGIIDRLAVLEERVAQIESNKPQGVRHGRSNE